MSIPSIHATSTIRRSLIGSVAAILMMSTAVPVALAEEGSASSTSENGSCSPVAQPPTGITQPTGADSATYTYNSCTGLWENQYYTWSPATKHATPKTPYIYSCDIAHWQWTSSQWVYSPVLRAFRQVPFTVSQLPYGAVIAAGSPNPCAAPAPTSQQMPSTASTAEVGTSAQSGQTQGGYGGTVAIDRTGNVTVGNQINSSSQSGDVAAAANSAIGDTASGNATAMSNVINNVQSSSTLNGNVVGFTANINGDVQGDLVIDPSRLQPASDSTPLSATDVTVHTEESGTVNNDIHLNAATGNAAVTDNTKAGSATTGNAAAVANVINVLNSIVSAGKSFVGVVNINGSLHGNILVPQSFLSQLLATNAPHATMTLSAADVATLGITNSVMNNATTGTATATGNTQSGNVTTGTAATKVTIFNLTGAQLVGSNCMLVFVNVSGTWVGVIMNAQGGTTAAAIGDAASKYSATTAAVDTTNNAIHNDINVAATSGNAAATDNTAVGAVRSGNAATAVNLLNLNNSQLNLSGWFGVLFVNVFGNWFGNFGVYTPTAVPAKTAVMSDQAPVPAHASVPSLVRQHPVFQFVTQAQSARVGARSAIVGGSDPSLALVSAQLTRSTGHTLGASVAELKASTLKPAAVAAHSANPMQLAGSVLLIVGIATLVVERFVSIRQEHKPDAAH